MGRLDICSLGKILKSSCLVGRHRKFYKTEVDDITLQELELLNVKTRTDSRPFHERHAITCACIHTHKSV